MNIAPNSETKNNIDALYDQAVAFVFNRKDTSCSGLQRHFKIGYSLALKLKERLEKNGMDVGIEPRIYRTDPEHVTIKVIDIGATGCNVAEEIIGKDISGIEIISVKADVPTLMRSSQHAVIPTGEVRDNNEIKPEGKHQLPMKSRSQIEEALLGAHIVLVVAGMADDIRYGDVSIAAEIAREQGALSIAVVYEPTPYQKLADEELRAMTSPADALFVIPNIQLRERDDNATIASEFEADSITPGAIISKWIRSIVSAMVMPNLFNVGLNDFCHTMTGSRKSGCATIKPAWSEARGADRALVATAKALAHPSFRKHLSQADGMLLIITMANPESLMQCEVNQISEDLYKHVPECCLHSVSVRFNQCIPIDALRVEILASHWAV